MLKTVVATAFKAAVFTEQPAWRTVAIDPSCCITHQYCNDRALGILQEQGFIKETLLLGIYYKQLQDGVIWADLNWKNIHHFLHPKTRRGFWRFSNAAGDYLQFFSLAVKCMEEWRIEDAIFYLGAAAHLVQDMCVPHHARCQLFDGHKKYEMWVEQNLQFFFPPKMGEIVIVNPAGLLIDNAAIAWEFYNEVNGEAGVEQYQKATEVLLPLAQKSTVNLFCYFFNAVKKLGGGSPLDLITKDILAAYCGSTDF